MKRTEEEIIEIHYLLHGVFLTTIFVLLIILLDTPFIYGFYTPIFLFGLIVCRFYFTKISNFFIYRNNKDLIGYILNETKNYNVYIRGKIVGIYNNKIGKLAVFIFSFIALILLASKLEFKFFSFIFSLYIFWVLFELIIWTREIINKSEINSNLKSVKSKNKKNYDIYTWLGEEKSIDKIIYELLGDIEEKETTLETLRSLKEKIKKQLNNNLSDYYLIKEVIINERKESFASFALNSFKTVLVSSIGVAIITSLISNETFKGWLNRLPTVPNFNFSWDSWLTIMSFGFYFILIVMLLQILFSTFTKPKRRTSLFLIAINEVIREIEDKNK